LTYLTKTSIFIYSVDQNHIHQEILMKNISVGISLLFILNLLAPSYNGLYAQKSKTSVLDSLTPNPKLLKSFSARSIGPAIMGGRVSTIALDPNDIYTFYVGLGTGGVFKTENSGATFSPIFEKEAVAAIGAIAVSPTNTKQVWVGTGEANDRNSSSWGNGIYKSTDGGSLWTNVGLKNSKTISRIVVHPRDTNIVYVAALGDLWMPNPDRGLYKTTDGGKSWNNILTSTKPYNDKIGCVDVEIDTSNPDIIYAAMYARQRTPWSFTSGADLTDGKDLGGIFKSTDAGASWKKLGGGLPPRTQNIGLDIYSKNPKIIYAIVQSDEGGTSSIDENKSKRGGVFRSEDGGENWSRMNPLNPRPFYFSQIRIDPTNDQRIYLLGYMVHVSDDGGKTFMEDSFDKVHSDCHELVIDPRNPKRLLLGTDGGVYQSFASGKNWIFLNNIPAGEYYRIAVDLSTPYRIAGGLQDNTNWVGPSRTSTKEGILNTDWLNIGGGDGFYCVFDPLDSNLVYAESQQGYVHRYNMKSGEFKGLRPEQTEGQPAYRFHWNSPLIGSQHYKGVMYLAGNHIFKLTERGENFKIISPDLSTQDLKKMTSVGSGAENFGVVYTLAESPLKAGLLWAGTDDGKLWITMNEGESWTDLTKYLPKEIQGEWISRVEPGHHDANTVYMAVDAHRNGDYIPHVYKTTDAGKSWKSISGNLPTDNPVKVVREGLKNSNLLFTGTEFNLFMSLDQGKKWVKFGELPTVAVDDIIIHPRDYDLIIATHGRSLYIVDDILPHEETFDTVLTKDAYLFPIRSAYGYYPNGGWVESSGAGVFRGANPPEGAIINYYIKEYTGEPPKFTITNSAGKTVANLTGSVAPGFNRLPWDLKPTSDLLIGYGGEGAKFWKSGEYTVTMNLGKTKQTVKFQVKIADGIETR
jgi:photosystem II stability/assembly factor-like uncharacterized protein